MSAQFPVTDDLGLKPIKLFMTKPVIAAQVGTPIEIAIKMMLTHKISGLPVVDAQGKIIGSYSEWDALIQGASHKLTEAIAYKAPPIVANHNSSFRAAVALLIKTKIKRLFIVDDKNFLLGLVSRTDILKNIFKDHSKGRDSK